MVQTLVSSLWINTGVSLARGNFPLDFGRIEGTNGQQQRPALLLAPQVLGSLLRPCNRLVITKLGISTFFNNKNQRQQNICAMLPLLICFKKTKQRNVY